MSLSQEEINNLTVYNTSVTDTNDNSSETQSYIEKLETQVKILSEELEGIKRSVYTRGNPKSLLKSEITWEKEQTYDTFPIYHNERIVPALAYGSFTVGNAINIRNYPNNSSSPIPLVLEPLYGTSKFVSRTSKDFHNDFNIENDGIHFLKSGQYKFTINVNGFTSSSLYPSKLGLYTYDSNAGIYSRVSPLLIIKNTPDDINNAGDSDCSWYSLSFVLWVSADSILNLMNIDSVSYHNPILPYGGNIVDDTSLFLGMSKPVCIIVEMLERAYVV